MIFAICGLTVEGTGTDRAGTSSVWAWAVVETMAAHNNAATGSFRTTAVEFPAVGIFIAAPLFNFLLFFNADRDDAHQTPPLQPHARSIIPQPALIAGTDRIAAGFVIQS
jgi:hypothetical protein